jgi:hypothetical protein
MQPNRSDINDPYFSKNQGSFEWDPASQSWKNKEIKSVNAKTAAPGTQPTPPSQLNQGDARSRQFRADAAAAMQQGDFTKQFMPTLASRATGRGLPQTQFDDAAASQARGSQQALLDQLLKQARGETDSPAQLMLQQAADRNLSDASAMAASQRGLGATAAASQASGQRAQIGQEAARDAGILRLQEQMQATQAASRVAEGLRGQDIGQAQAQAQVKLASDNLFQSLVQRAIEAGMSQDQAMMQARAQMLGLSVNRDLGFGNLDQRAREAWQAQMNNDRNFIMGLVGGFGQGAVGVSGLGGKQ